MILRKITDEEIQAITTLFQCAENIGSEAYSEADVMELIKTTWENTPPVRAKDAGITWMLDFMKKMADVSEENYRISFIDDAAYRANKVADKKAAPTPDKGHDERKNIIPTKKVKALYIVRGKGMSNNGDSVEWYFTNNKQLNIKQKHLFSKEILADIKRDMKDGGFSYDVDAANELFTKKQAFYLIKKIINKKMGNNNKITRASMEAVSLPLSTPCIPAGAVADADFRLDNDWIVAYGNYVPTPTSTPGTAQFEEMPF